MKLGIIGLPQAGKSTIFAALTGARGERGDHATPQMDARIATVTVFDERIDFLSQMYQPKKTTYARIEYLLPPKAQASHASKSEGGFWNKIRSCDALVHVVRNFEGHVGSPPTPEEDFFKLEEEMILSDLEVVEKRIERITLDRKRGKGAHARETDLLKSCADQLDQGAPIRGIPELASSPVLRGFTFLSAKPVLVLLNNEDEDETLPRWERETDRVDLIVVRGRLEMDIASMSAEEAEEFLEAYHIRESALDRVIRSSFQVLNRVSFFTVGSDEVRAWPIAANTSAMEAAGAVHSDMKQGFIRAEVVYFEDLKACGSIPEARKAGLVRLEGKEYEVKDGDIIDFRFNV